MALLNNKKNYIFFHLYKCGGNSIRNVIKPHLSDVTSPNEFEEIGNAHCVPKDIQKIYYEKNKKELFDNYFKFTFVRNPFDWLLSTYYYIIKTNHELNSVIKNMTFYQFLEYYINVMMKNENKQLGHNKVVTLYEYITDDSGELAVDFVGKYENIQDDMKFVCNKINTQYKIVPFINVNINRERDYKKYYDAQSINFVKKHFEKDLDYFKYTF
jgi:chondroitin 4-sulfotransferase 11